MQFSQMLLNLFFLTNFTRLRTHAIHIIPIAPMYPRDSMPLREPSYIRALKYSSLTALMTARDSLRQDFLLFAQKPTNSLIFAFRYDDISLMKFIIAKFNIMKQLPQVVGNMICKIYKYSIPNSRSCSQDDNFSARNCTKSWRIFEYVLATFIDMLGIHFKKNLDDNDMCVKVAAYFLELSVFAENIAMLNVIAHAFDITRVTRRLWNFLEPDTTFINDDIATKICEYGLCEYFKDCVSSREHDITQTDHELFAPRSLTVMIARGQNIDDIIKILSTHSWYLFTSVANLGKIDILYQLCAYDIEPSQHSINVNLSYGATMFSVMLAHMRANGPHNRYANMIEGLINTLSFECYPIQYLMRRLRAIDDTLARNIQVLEYFDIQRRLFLNLCEHMSRGNVSIDTVILRLVTATDVDDVTHAIAQMHIEGECDKHCCAQHDHIRKITKKDFNLVIDYAIHQHAMIKPVLPECANFLSTVARLDEHHDSRTTFIIGALIGDVILMRESGYLLDMQKTFDMKLLRMMFMTYYARANMSTVCRKFINRNIEVNAKIIDILCTFDTFALTTFIRALSSNNLIKLCKENMLLTKQHEYMQHYCACANTCMFIDLIAKITLNLRKEKKRRTSHSPPIPPPLKSI